MRTRTITRASDESGVALIITLFLLAAISALASSLMFLSQTETYATMNYTMMTQARYAGEAGVEKTVNWLVAPMEGLSTGYTLPSSGSSTDPTSNYTMTTSPVTCSGGSGCLTTTGTCSYTPGLAPTGPCVVLSAMNGVTSNYPDANTVTAFASAGTGTLTSGSSPIGYSTYAVLMSMQQLGSGSVVQTWSIVSNGTVTGARTATVQVVSTLETPMKGTTGNGYAAFATGSGCGAITLSGSAGTNSYNSATYGGSGTPTLSTTGGSIGTNGNLTESGSATIWGKLYTPRSGVGPCSSGDALTKSGSATVKEGLVALAAAWAPPTPSAPSPAPPTTSMSVSSVTTCASSGLPSCTGTSGNLTVAGGSTLATATAIGNLSVSGSAQIHIGSATAGACNPCYYSINSLSMSGSTRLILDGGSVVINVAGNGGSGTVWSMSGSSNIVNPSYVASNVQINYGGTRSISQSGGTSSSAVLDAPNSAVTLSGGSDFYGSILASTISDSGSVSIHYDSALSSMYSTQTTGVPLLTSFSWKKY